MVVHDLTPRDICIVEMETQDADVGSPRDPIAAATITLKAEKMKEKKKHECVPRTDCEEGETEKTVAAGLGVLVAPR